LGALAMTNRFIQASVPHRSFNDLFGGWSRVDLMKS
jgi:hypothetical protein